MADKRKGKRSQGDLLRIGGAVVVVALVGVSSVLHFQGAKEEAAEIAVAWTLTGRQCPTLPAGAAAPPLPRQLQHEGVAFSRERGPVFCNSIRPNGEGDPVPVCMFPNPGTLRVQSPGGTETFALGGEPATVYVRDGGLECVMAVNNALFAR